MNNIDDDDVDVVDNNNKNADADVNETSINNHCILFYENLIFLHKYLFKKTHTNNFPLVFLFVFDVVVRPYYSAYIKYTKRRVASRVNILQSIDFVFIYAFVYSHVWMNTHTKTHLDIHIQLILNKHCFCYRGKQHSLFYIVLCLTLIWILAIYFFARVVFIENLLQ